MNIEQAKALLEKHWYTVTEPEPKLEEAVKRVERIVAVCTPHVNTPHGKMTYTGPDLPERFATLSDEILSTLNS